MVSMIAYLLYTLVDMGDSVEGTNVITGHKCNKGHKCNNIWSQM